MCSATHALDPTCALMHSLTPLLNPSQDFCHACHETWQCTDCGDNICKDDADHVWCKECAVDVCLKGEEGREHMHYCVQCAVYACTKRREMLAVCKFCQEVVSMKTDNLHLPQCDYCGHLVCAGGTPHYSFCNECSQQVCKHDDGHHPCSGEN